MAIWFFMRFRGKIWESGDSKVITVPARLEAKKGDEFWVTLEPFEEVTE